jgi:hypothetical protein
MVELKNATQLEFGDGLPTGPGVGWADATAALKPSPPIARRPVAAVRTILFRICPSFQLVPGTHPNLLRATLAFKALLFEA